LVAPWTPRKSVEYDETVGYTCLEGYTVGGHAEFNTEFSVTFPDNGVLTDPEVCEPVKCGRAPRISNGRAAISGDVFFGMHLEYNCDTGYTLDGSLTAATEFQRHCLKDATFSDLPSERPCKPIHGGKAPALQNAIMTEYGGRPVAADSLPDIYYPNGLEYQCKAGHSENGSPSGPTKISSRVNSLGKLSPALPFGCMVITFTVRGQVKDSRNGRRLAGATVQVVGGSHEQTSNGFFALTGMRSGSVTLVYKKSGYIDSRKTFDVSGNINTGGLATSPCPRKWPLMSGALLSSGTGAQATSTHMGNGEAPKYLGWAEPAEPWS